MDLENPYLAPASDIVSEGPRSILPKSLKEAVWRGAKTSLKWITYLFGPLSLLMLFFFLGVLIFATFSEVGRKAVSENPMFYLRMLGRPVAAYLVFCLYGAIIGAVIGGLMHTARGFQTFLRRKKAS